MFICMRDSLARDTVVIYYDNPKDGFLHTGLVCIQVMDFDDDKDEQDRREGFTADSRLGRRPFVQSIAGIGIGSVIVSDGVGTAEGAGSSASRSTQTNDPAPNPEDYPDILADMDGTGTEEDPYLVTDVVGLQAMDGERDAHFELSNDIDADETEQWNVIDRTVAFFFRDQEEYQLGYPPIEEGSEKVEFNQSGEELDSDEYSIDYESGKLELVDDLPENEQIVILYVPTGNRTAGFVPIGGNRNPFTGHLDGAGYEIRSLHIDRQNRTSVALIDTTEESAVIENVSLEAANIQASGQGAGFVGISEDVLLKQVSFNGAVEILESSRLARLAGGLVADLRGGQVHESSASGTVTGEQAGGLVGGIAVGGDTVDQILIENSYSIVDVSGAQPGGGLVGSIGVGGGFEATVRLQECYAAGTVNGEEESYGGCAGSLRDHEGESRIEIRDTYWDEENSTQSDGIGRVDAAGIITENLTGLQTSAVQGAGVEESMDALDFDGTWMAIADPAYYPFLQWQTVGLLPVVGNRLPRDPDSDGLYEDIDGDGEFTIGDVQAFFQNRNSDVVQANSELFNFSGNNPDEVTVGDIQGLFQRFSNRER